MLVPRSLMTPIATHMRQCWGMGVCYRLEVVYALPSGTMVARKSVLLYNIPNDLCIMNNGTTITITSYQEITNTKEYIEKLIDENDQTKEPIAANLPVGKNCKLVDWLVICNWEYADCEFEVKYQTPWLKSECLDWQQIDQMPIYAYAPYNDIDWVDRYNVNSKLLELYTLTWSQDAESNYPNWPTAFDQIWYLTGANLDVKWVKMNNNDNLDYIKYSNLNLSSDFAIEMSVEVLNDTSSTKYYLIHSWNDIRLWIQYWKLYFNETDPSLWINLWTWFQKIKLIKKWTKIYAEYNWTQTSEKNLTNPINEIIVWAFYSSSLWYVWQLNSIIDYIKIYK